MLLSFSLKKKVTKEKVVAAQFSFSSCAEASVVLSEN
jgi:hypothetical protein